MKLSSSNFEFRELPADYPNKKDLKDYSYIICYTYHETFFTTNNLVYTRT